MKCAKKFYRIGLLKNKKMLTQSQIPSIAFAAELNNVKHFYNALKAINFAEDCLIQISDKGFKIIVEESRSVQACCYVTRSYFDEYRLLKDEYISFGVKINVITECLSLFSTGNDTNLKMVCKSEGSPLVFVLEQPSENLVIECSIRTSKYDSFLDLNMDDDSVENTIILNSPDFFRFLNDIDKADDEVEIIISPTVPNLTFSTLSNISSEIKIEVCKTSEMIFSFSTKSLTKYRYKANHIRYVMKALMLGQTISLRTEKNGLLGIQIIIVNEGPKQICIEYFITPLINSDII